MRYLLSIKEEKVDIDNIIYASAFIDPNILNVRYINKKLEINSSKKINLEKLKKSVKILIDRFPRIINNNQPIYKRIYKKKKINYIKKAENKKLIQKIDSGLFIFKNELADLINFLDYSVMKFYSKEFSAKEELYPNMIKAETLEKANHISSFPEHLLFNFHLKEDLHNINLFSKRSKNRISSINNLAKLKFIQNPSTCFHCYSSRENQILKKNEVITAITKCNRYESSNHSNTGRLIEFLLREVIFLGTSRFVQKTRDKSLEITKKIADRWEIAGEIVSSNDPFFTSDFNIKANYQIKFNMKYEFKCNLPYENRNISIMSSNLHGTTFSKNFNFNNKNKNIQTGCLGFGLERFALVILSQHGININKWPKKLCTDFVKWKKYAN